ncbi:MAG: hypothetical protein ACRDP6_48005 [Actinoallomurus sp.]
MSRPTEPGVITTVHWAHQHDAEVTGALPAISTPPPATATGLARHPTGRS